jgi:hypothetical protein
MNCSGVASCGSGDVCVAMRMPVVSVLASTADHIKVECICIIEFAAIVLQFACCVAAGCHDFQKVWRAARSQQPWRCIGGEPHQVALAGCLLMCCFNTWLSSSAEPVSIG